MRFLLLLHSPRTRWDAVPADGTDEEMEAHVALIGELDARGQLVDCSPLATPEPAVEVAARIPDAATSKVLVHPLLNLEPVPTGPRPATEP